MTRDSLLIDCTTCSVRGDACHGCFVTAIWGEVPSAGLPRGEPRSGMTREPDDVDRAIRVLAAAGLLAPEEIPIGLLPLTAEPTRRVAGA